MLANPPYVRQELISAQKPTLAKVYPEVYAGTADLYVFFYARALQLLRPGGMLAFISPNKWFRAGYGAKLRAHIAQTCRVISITDFGELPVFEAAATFPMVFVANRAQHTAHSTQHTAHSTQHTAHSTQHTAHSTQHTAHSTQHTLYTQVKSLKPPYPDVRELVRENGQTLPASAIAGANWTLTDAASASRLRTMEQAGVPLSEFVKGKIYYGVKTGLNAAFVITGAKRAELIASDPKSTEIIKPLAVGDDVRRWCIRDKGRWLIYSPWDLDIDKYPAIKHHLMHWKAELQARPECRDGRYKWWCMARYGAEYVDEYAKPKIVYPVICKDARFAYDTTGAFTNDKAFIIASGELYLLGVMNSAPVWDYLRGLCSVLGDADNGGRLELRGMHVSRVPIPNAPVADRDAISALVQHCLDAKGVGCEHWEADINTHVAALYGL